MSAPPAPIARWLEGIDALALILWIAAICTLIGFAIRTVRKSIPALKKLIALSDSLDRLPVWMDDTDKKLDEIRHELFPNNGGSMRDDLQTVSLQVQQLKAHQDKDYARLGALEDTVTRRLERQTGPIDTQED